MPRSFMRATPHGVAAISETATDNPTRTGERTQHILQGRWQSRDSEDSVSFLFRHMGVFRLQPEGIESDDQLYLIDHGLDRDGRESESDKGEP
ncbi:MAG: hypothetical protein R3E72_01705 [Steroidobacteraceae bacterium]